MLPKEEVLSGAVALREHNCQVVPFKPKRTFNFMPASDAPPPNPLKRAFKHAGSCQLLESSTSGTSGS
jgi:hypothetical protein